MPFTQTCPECDNRMTVPDEAAGKKLRCRTCGRVFRAGSADVDVVDEAGAPPPKRAASDRPRRPRDDRDEDDRPARRSGPARRPAKGRGKKKAGALPAVLVLLALVVLGGGGGLAYYLLAGRGTPTEYADPEGMFTARFPDPPAASVAVDPTGPGAANRVGERVAHVQVGDNIYSVTVLGPFAPRATVGPRWRDQQLRQHAARGAGQGDEVVNQSVVHDGHTGAQIGVLNPDGWMTVTRVVASERWVLRFQVVHEAGNRAAAVKFVAEAEKFFDTVRVGPAFGPPLDAAPPAVPADALAAAYRADPAAADAKYKGRYLDLTARVTGLRTDNTGRVVGVESGAHGHVLEFFIPAGMDGFKPGDSLFLTGQCEGLERGRAGPPRVRFMACQLLAPDGSLAPPGARPPPSGVPKAVTRDPPKAPAGGAGPPKSAATPPTLTADQRKILGKWERKISGRRLTVEFKADGEMIEMEEGPDGTMKLKDEHKRRFRFVADRRFVQTVDGLDLFGYEVLALDATRMTLLHERFGSENEYTRVE